MCILNTENFTNYLRTYLNKQIDLKNHLKRFLVASEHHKATTDLSVRGHFRQFTDRKERNFDNPQESLSMETMDTLCDQTSSEKPYIIIYRQLCFYLSQLVLEHELVLRYKGNFFSVAHDMAGAIC